MKPSSFTITRCCLICTIEYVVVCKNCDPNATGSLLYCHCGSLGNGWEKNETDKTVSNLSTDCECDVINGGPEKAKTNLCRWLG